MGFQPDRRNGLCHARPGVLRAPDVPYRVVFSMDTEQFSAPPMTTGR